MTLIIAEGKPPGRKPNKPGAGRPDKLTDDIIRNTAAAVRNHQRMEVAAVLAGADRDTFYHWLAAAADASERIAEGARQSDLTAYQKKCLKLRHELEKARDQAEGLCVNGIAAAGLKRQVTEKRVRKVVGTDDSNQPIWVEEVTITETPPDTRNLQWWLKTQRPKHYAERNQLEVTGANGGPVEIEFAHKLSAIEETIRNHQAAIAAESREAE